ncbi:MAG: hypothetical protein LM564_01990 [Desulfurococcaceae archaeon]|nr:hypothetical protein [Desulfurococcaceae archaeon]
MVVITKRVEHSKFDVVVKELEEKGFECVLLRERVADCMIEEDSGEVIHYIIYT